MVRRGVRLTLTAAITGMIAFCAAPAALAAPGDISTVAGNGTAAFTGDGGLATIAALNKPEG
jgi:hypothetical protein